MCLFGSMDVIWSCSDSMHNVAVASVLRTLETGFTSAWDRPVNGYITED